MIKSQQPQVGDRIVTTKKFCPINKDKKKLGPFPDLKGIVIFQIGNAYGIQFEKQEEWTHDLEKIIVTKTGAFLGRDDFKILDSYSSKDKNKTAFVKTINQASFNELIRIPQELDELKNNIKYKQDEIKSYKRNIESYFKQIATTGKQINTLKKKAQLRPEYSTFELQFDKLKKSSKIKDIKVLDRYIIITTNDLTYKKTSRIPSDFVIGAFKIFIPISIDNEVKIINYKRHLFRTHFHPCIRRGGEVCTGEEVRNEINELRKKNQIDLLTFLMISFIEKPDYGTPFIDDLSMMCAQDVTIKPKNEMDWLNSSYWNEHEKWDDTKYNEERAALSNQMNNPPRSQS
jgi:hypothetical protein